MLLTSLDRVQGMRSLVLDYLDGVYRELSGETSGSVADYIPELAIVDPDSFAICLAVPIRMAISG